MLRSISARLRSIGLAVVEELKTNAINIGFAVALLTLVLASIASYQSITGLRDRVRLVEHTQKVQLQIEELLAAFSAARVTWRDFLAAAAAISEPSKPWRRASRPKSALCKT